MCFDVVKQDKKFALMHRKSKLKVWEGTKSNCNRLKNHLMKQGINYEWESPDESYISYSAVQKINIAIIDFLKQLGN